MSEEDPFSPENIGILHFVQLGRIYDVLMTDFSLRHPEIAEEMIKRHQQGDLLGVPPNFSGRFLSDEE